MRIDLWSSERPLSVNLAALAAATAVGWVLFDRPSPPIGDAEVEAIRRRVRFEVVEDRKRARAGGAQPSPIDVQMPVDVRIDGTRTLGSGTIVRARVAVAGGEPSERYFRASWKSRLTGDVAVVPSTRLAWNTRPW